MVVGYCVLFACCLVDWSLFVVFVCWLLFVGCCLLFDVCWLLFVVLCCWLVDCLLVVGSWSLVVDYCGC